MIYSICFTNFGPYHFARLRALARAVHERGDCLVGYEVASSEYSYPWVRTEQREPFEWITLFPNKELITISSRACRKAITDALNRDMPDVIGIVGYARPESLAAVRWARRNRRWAILMSESQWLDRPRVWWKEVMKSRRVGMFNAALVGGPTHRDYLAKLGMPIPWIKLGYNAVDNSYYYTKAGSWCNKTYWSDHLPKVPFFLCVCRFVPEKNLVRLIKGFMRYREQAPPSNAWDLVICGDGPLLSPIRTLIKNQGYSKSVHLPGFLQASDLAYWYAHASAFVLPSQSEPWGLVANEAASCKLPLLISKHAGCAQTLVPDPEGTTGAQFNPLDISEITNKLVWMAMRPPAERGAMGKRAAELVKLWGPERFAHGMLDAIASVADSQQGNTWPTLGKV